MTSNNINSNKISNTNTSSGVSRIIYQDNFEKKIDFGIKLKIIIQFNFLIFLRTVKNKQFKVNIFLLKNY